MKKIVLSLMAFATIFTSCSNDLEIESNPGVDVVGKDTYVKFSLNSGGVATRATRAADEDGVKTANIYIFEAGALVAQQLDVTGAAPSIKLSAGIKEVLLVTNNAGNWGVDSTFPTFENGATIASVRTELEALAVNNPHLAIAKTDGLNYANLDGALGFVMNSSTVVDFPAGGTDVAPLAIHIPVLRTASKLAVGVHATTVNLPGAISNSAFAVLNTSMNTSLGRQYYEKGASPINIDGTTNTATLVNNFTASVSAPELNIPTTGTYYTHLYGYEQMKATDITTLVDNAWKPAAETAAASSLGLDAILFMPENIVKGMAAGSEASKGEATYSVLKTKYTPVATEFNAIPGTTTTTGTFFAIRNIASQKLMMGDLTAPETTIGFFYDATTAGTFITTNAGALLPGVAADYESVEYKEGLMYYRINLSNAKFAKKTTEKYSVLRNSSYLMDINSINDYGTPDVGELPGEPTDPIEETVHLNVTIKVIDYTEIATTPDLD